MKRKGPGHGGRAWHQPSSSGAGQRTAPGLTAGSGRSTARTTGAYYYRPHDWRGQDLIDPYSPLVEWFWRLWCRVAWALQQIEHWLASRRSGPAVAVVEGVVETVSAGDGAFGAYEDMGLSVAARALLTWDYSDDWHAEVYHRATPVVIRLADGGVIHFCEYQVTTIPVQSNAPYFAGLKKGTEVRAAGWWDQGVFSAWGLHLRDGRESELVYAARPPRDLPQRYEDLLARRSDGFSYMAGTLGMCGVVMLATSVIALLTGEIDVDDLGLLSGALALLILLVPMAILLVIASMRVLAGPLRTVPEMMAQGLFGAGNVRFQTYDFGRCEKDVLHALQARIRHPSGMAEAD